MNALMLSVIVQMKIKEKEFILINKIMNLI